MVLSVSGPNVGKHHPPDKSLSSINVLGKPLHHPLDIEDITWPRRDTNFSSSVEKYFTSEGSQQVKYFFQQEKRNVVSPSDHVMFYLLYKHQ